MRIVGILLILILLLTGIYFLQDNKLFQAAVKQVDQKTDQLNDLSGVLDTQNPLTIEYLRSVETPGSDLVIEEVLPAGSNYNRYIASYQSEGLKIHGLLTIPRGTPPKDGWPAIIFNHGYIPPNQYVTTERYIAYTDAFSRNGYVLFRPDYRGHGNSEGEATGGYGNNGYTIDVLNALSSVKRLAKPTDTATTVLGASDNPLVDITRIGMWGHSMGGYITLRSMVVNKDIKAGVIWAGVVASYPDLVNNWRRGNRTVTPSPLPSGARRWRDQLREVFGEPSEDNEFWRSISANFYLSDISGPLQLHHGTADSSVPVEFSQKLERQMKAAGKTVEYYEYPGDDHDITANFGIAAQRSVEFFDQYLKADQ